MTSSDSVLEAQISEQLDVYLAVFNAGDYTTAAAHYNEPSVSISAGAVMLIPARKDFANFIACIVDRLRQDGFDHSEWASPKKIIVLENTADKGLVIASCTCKRLRRDGTSCEEFSATYTLRMTDDHGWLIASIHSHPIETQLK